jgi:hypothetical protein
MRRHDLSETRPHGNVCVACQVLSAKENDPPAKQRISDAPDGGIVEIGRKVHTANFCSRVLGERYDIDFSGIGSLTAHPDPLGSHGDDMNASKRNA